MIRHLAIALALSAATASLAHAQPRPPAPKPAPESVEKIRARALLKAGNDLAKQGRQREALALYEDAYRIYPDSKLLINIGKAHHELGDFLEAAGAYQRFLDDPARAPEQVAGAEAALATLDKLVTRVQLAVETTDATPVEIALDAGAWIPLPAGRFVRVAPGAHRVQARGGGVPFVTEAAVDAVAGVPQVVTIVLVAAPPPPPPVEDPPHPPPPIEPPPIEASDARVVEAPAPPRAPSRFGALVHLVVQYELEGATGALGATFAAHDRVTLSAGAMAGGNYGGFVAATVGLLPGRLRPTLTVGAVLSYYGGTDEMTDPATTLFGGRGAVGAEWRVSRRLSAIADLAAEYYPSPPSHVRALSITPTVGVHARL